MIPDELFLLSQELAEIESEGSSQELKQSKRYHRLRKRLMELKEDARERLEGVDDFSEFYREQFSEE